MKRLLPLALLALTSVAMTPSRRDGEKFTYLHIYPTLERKSFILSTGSDDGYIESVEGSVFRIQDLFLEQDGLCKPAGNRSDARGLPP